MIVSMPGRDATGVQAVRKPVIIVLLLMIASLVLVFCGITTDATFRLQEMSPFTHLVVMYAGLLVTLLSHIVAFAYIIGLRNMLIFGPPDDQEETQETSPTTS